MRNLGLEKGNEVSSMLGGQEEEVKFGSRDRAEWDRGEGCEMGGSRVRSYWRSGAKESSFGSKGVGGSREERLASWWEESQAGWGCESDGSTLVLFYFFLRLLL